MNLINIVEERDYGPGKAFNVVIQWLIVLSVVTFTIETLPNLSDRSRNFLRWIETFLVVIFTVEYLLRIAASKRKLGFIFSFYGLIDLLAILPFYLATTIDLRSVRIFRLLRLIRILKLVRYHAAIQRLRRAFTIAREEIFLYLAVTFMLLYMTAVGIYFFEHTAQPDKFASVFHSLWWSVATLTTVGYGDIYPVTTGGRIFTFFVLIIGVGIVAIPAGLIASALANTRDDNGGASA